MTTTPPGLSRRLGTADAVVIGLAAMIGAGVFVAFAPAARAAGAGLLAGLALALLVATCNATSSAQLAAQYPTSGGTYVYGRERLGEWWGFLAGWGFVVGKTASCAAMALTFAAYAVPGPWQEAAAVGAVVALTALGYRGVTRTARLARVLVAVTLAALAAAVVAGLTGDTSGGGQGWTWTAGWYGVLQSAGLLFFAFAGYARVATLGEEVRDPRRTIPRAVLVALALTAVVYALVGVTLLSVLGADRVAATPTPVLAAVEAAGRGWAVPVVVLGAAAAALGALLALLAGVARTTLAMAREGDLPRPLAAVHPRYQVPHRAEVLVGAAVCVLVLVVDLRGAIGFSSFGVLLYYLVANLAALTQEAGHRRFPRPLQVLGATGCVALAATLPPASVVGGLVVVGAGVALRAARLLRRRAGTSTF